MTALPAWRQRLAAVAVLMPHSFSVRLEPDDACWIRAPAAVMAVHESNFHAPCCEACGKEWVKTVPTAESDPFVMVLTELHVHPARTKIVVQTRLSVVFGTALQLYSSSVFSNSIITDSMNSI